MQNKTNKKTFYILSPPPNITGSLHIGHAFTFSVQDFIARMQLNFMKKTSCLLGGFDHGGLSTEKAASHACVLNENRVLRFQQIQNFAENAKNNIDTQFKKLNLLMPEKFKKYTFDPDHEKLVRDTFIKLYRLGLIKRDVGLVNFDTKLKTAISDLEVTRKTIKSKLYKLKYILADGALFNGQNFIEVATTRPETIFADIALCVNPNDQRYADLINLYVYVPIIDRKIPIITDDSVDEQFGTGVLKITPAHDINDHRIFSTNKSLKDFELLNIIDFNGKLNLHFLAEKGQEFHALSVSDARKKIAEDLSLDFIEIDQNIPVGEKSGAPIEHLLLEQWFFDISTGAKMALEKMESLPIFPEIWRNTYKNWLENINPWCISRSTVWGHDIPAWFLTVGACESVRVQEDSPGEGWYKKNEVLDTWFSSALWPLLYKQVFEIGTVDVLVSAYDILFFWIARMVMMNLILEGTMPFKAVYLHRLVTDKEGKKMSKTVGNVVDPLDLIKEHGSDVLRLALLKTLSPCGKIRIGEDSMAEAKSIITKLKNFQTYLDISKEYVPLSNSDQKIVHHFRSMFYEMEQRFFIYLNTYELHLILHEMVGFLYELCSWFLEFSKIRPGLLSELLKSFEKISCLFACIIPEFFETKVFDYTYESFCDKTEEIDALKHVISEIRSYKKLGINVEIADGEFTDIICRMTQCGIGQNGIKVNIGEYTIFLNGIKEEIIRKKIYNLEQEEQILQTFLDKTSNETPGEIIEEKGKNFKKIQKELRTLRDLL